MMQFDPNNPPVTQRILTDDVVAREWPHQVNLPAHMSTGKRYQEQRKFCDLMGFDLCGRHGSAWIDGRAYRTFAFTERRHAQSFAGRFGGIRYIAAVTSSPAVKIPVIGYVT